VSSATDPGEYFLSFSTSADQGTSLFFMNGAASEPQPVSIWTWFEFQKIFWKVKRVNAYKVTKVVLRLIYSKFANKMRPRVGASKQRKDCSKGAKREQTIRERNG
jgi:hypothetical protein